MRCKTCDYALWNLRSRTCPECGAAFKPSDFELIPNSVRFGCPHCQQVYYGTDEHGHLVPRSFACVSCCQAIDMDEMVLLPAEGLDDAQTRWTDIPWVEGKRDGRSFIGCWLKTMKMAMFAPGQLGTGLTRNQPRLAAFGFSLFTLFLISIIGTAVSIVFFGLIVGGLAGFAGGGTGGGPPGFGPATIAFISSAGFMFVLSGFAWFVMVVLWALCAHGILRMMGPTDGGLRRTMDVMLYSSAAWVLALVPCLGVYGLSQIWSVVSATIMLARAQRVSAGRAVLAAILPPVLAVVLLFSAYGVFVYYLFSAAGQRAMTTPAGSGAAIPISPNTARNQVQGLVSALNTHALVHGQGNYPAHASELIVARDATVTVFDFTTDPTQVTALDLGSSGARLRDLLVSQPGESARIATNAGKDLPPGVVAHRLGDYVFTYHGVKPGDAAQDAGLWIVVFAPNPGAAIDPTYTGAIVVGTVDGSVRGISLDDWSAALQQQNVLRAQHGLPPLPEPETVTAQQPAAAPADPAPDRGG